MATLALQTEVDNETLQYHQMVLKKNQHQLLEKIKEKELIEEMEIINPHPPYLIIQVETVTESTIIATIHRSDVGYCLFRNPLVTHIPYHVPSLLL